MIKVRRHPGSVWVLSLLLNIACQAQNPSNTPALPVEEPPPTPISSPTEEPTSTDTPDRPAGDCGPLIPPPQGGCARTAWFCNAAGDCGCHEELVSAPGPVVVARPAPAAAAPGAGTESQPQPPGSSCAGASVSAPQGECLVVNWFCNLSGLCRCRV
jgi:hypothetical protein